MIEIQLPCCDTQATLEPAATDVRCEACAIVHELAPDARATAPAGSRHEVAVPLAA
ncbi:MAG TPA: hypothetical protein VNH13_00155 [Candidatus Acidoferrales bacterium]|nr:hypothetical protein [Candidatus Acidoferrales bacterium]